MAQYHLRQLQHRFIPTIVFGASIGVSMVEKINTALVLFFVFLLFITNWRFFRLLRGEKKLRNQKI